MDSHEPQSPPPQQKSPPRSQPLHLQPTVVLACPNPFVNNTVPTTMMAPPAARCPPMNMSTTNPSPHSESFNNNTIVTAHSTTLQPCMKTVVEGSSSAFVPASGANRRKRGRPKKFVPTKANVDPLNSGSAEVKADQAPAPLATAPAPVATTPAVVTSPDSSTATKTKGRGRPHGSYSKQKNVQVHGHAGSCFVPHVINVNPGEDIIAKVTSAFRGGHNSQLCVLEATGYVSTVALRQSSGSVATFEGHFLLMSLSGSFEIFEFRKGYRRMTDWKVQIEGPDSRIIGGLVADKLIAASPVQVILGSFTLEDLNANYWDIKPYVPPSRFAASETPANAIVQEPASDQSPGDENDAIPAQVLFSDD